MLTRSKSNNAAMPIEAERASNLGPKLKVSPQVPQEPKGHAKKLSADSGKLDMPQLMNLCGDRQLQTIGKVPRRGNQTSLKIDNDPQNVSQEDDKAQNPACKEKTHDDKELSLKVDDTSPTERRDLETAREEAETGSQQEEIRDDGKNHSNDVDNDPMDESRDDENRSGKVDRGSQGDEGRDDESSGPKMSPFPMEEGTDNKKVGCNGEVICKDGKIQDGTSTGDLNLSAPTNNTKPEEAKAASMARDDASAASTFGLGFDKAEMLAQTFQNSSIPDEVNVMDIEMPLSNEQSTLRQLRGIGTFSLDESETNAMVTDNMASESKRALMSLLQHSSAVVILSPNKLLSSSRHSASPASNRAFGSLDAFRDQSGSTRTPQGRRYKAAAEKTPDAKPAAVQEAKPSLSDFSIRDDEETVGFQPITDPERLQSNTCYLDRLRKLGPFDNGSKQFLRTILFMIECFPDKGMVEKMMDALEKCHIRRSHGMKSYQDVPGGMFEELAELMGPLFGEVFMKSMGYQSIHMASFGIPSCEEDPPSLIHLAVAYGTQAWRLHRDVHDVAELAALGAEDLMSGDVNTKRTLWKDCIGQPVWIGGRPSKKRKAET